MYRHGGRNGSTRHSLQVYSFVDIVTHGLLVFKQLARLSGTPLAAPAAAAAALALADSRCRCRNLLAT